MIALYLLLTVWAVELLVFGPVIVGVALGVVDVSDTWTA